nr:Methyl-coenzyme M reductase II subunit gamma like [Ipomoea batatas]
MFKKVHPSAAPRPCEKDSAAQPLDYAGRPAETSRDVKAMWTPNVIIVEAYATRKIGKDNMKALENNDTTRNLQAAVKNISSSAGCFPVMFKKVHPSAAPPPPDSARHPAKTARDV